MSRSAPSSPVLGVRDHETLCVLRSRFAGDGVLGGEDVILVLALMLKLCIGRSASSSSLMSGDGSSSGIVDVNDTLEMLLGLKRVCLLCFIGDDSGRLCDLFQGCEGILILLPVRGPDDGGGGRTRFIDRIRFSSRPPDCGRSSENIGAVNGDELSPLLECSRLEVVEAASDVVSLLEAGLFLLSVSSTLGSIASKLMFSQPFCILTFARASRSCKALVICGVVSQGIIQLRLQ